MTNHQRSLSKSWQSWPPIAIADNEPWEIYLQPENDGSCALNSPPWTVGNKNAMWATCLHRRCHIWNKSDWSDDNGNLMKKYVVKLVEVASKAMLLTPWRGWNMIQELTLQFCGWTRKKKNMQAESNNAVLQQYSFGYLILSPLFDLILPKAKME